MKPMKSLIVVIITGMLAVASISGCQTKEASKKTQEETQKQRDMKEADKAAVEYIKAYIDYDTKKLNELQLKKYDFGPDKVVNPGASENLGKRYDLYRYDLKEGKDEYYYTITYYDAVEEAKITDELRIIKDPEDGKWKNYSLAWGDVHNIKAIVGSMRPVQVHKWGGKE